MNITLAADKELIERSRQYAQKHNTSLNSLVRAYLKSLAVEDDLDRSASEFAHLAEKFSGRSPSGYSFERKQVYDRSDR
jgi:hypothetical protein